jgi:hypothetical protein
MLAVLTPSAAAADWAGGVELRTCGGIARVILAVSEAALIFQRVRSSRPATNTGPVITKL